MTAVASQGTELHACGGEALGSATSGRRWSVGECWNANVSWSSFLEEESARQAFDAWTIWSSSRVLFNPEGVPAAFTSYHPVDCAHILANYGRIADEAPSRDVVADQVKRGEAPYVPPRRPGLVQCLLKAAMKLTFNRQSVRFFGSAPLRKKSLCYFDAERTPGVRGHVALTIDDAPCRFSSKNSRIQDVLMLLKEHRARATFMTIGRFVTGHEEDLVDLLRAGHELGNHGMMDRSYEFDSPEDFVKAVDTCSERIRDLQHMAGLPEDEQRVNWFRAPHGRYTREMHEVLHARNLTNVMCDTYASCPVVEDGAFIGEFLSENVLEGGIILVHMPERGFREWCFTGLQLLLRGLDRRGLRAVTVGELEARARESLAPGLSRVESGLSESGTPVECRRGDQP